MDALQKILIIVDDFVWGPVMLMLLVGTGIFLTIKTKFICWRNLPYSVTSVLSKEARQKKGDGDISPFSALTTALAATIGTGNIVGVATAMVSGGPGALVWMWISAFFGITSKFSECMLAIKYRVVNEKGEMSGGPMYTMKSAFKNKKVGAVLGWLFALFALFASFGIGNLTQANSISTSLNTTFNVPLWVTGIIIAMLVFLIIVGGIQSISKVSQVVVPFMALFYIIAGIAVIIGNISNLPAGIVMIFKYAFTVKATTGGVLGTVVASMMNSMRFGVARGCFSNEAGMGSAAITAAAATTDDCVRQGYINMTGTFWDTIVVCTITGLCIASSGVLGTTDDPITGKYTMNESAIVMNIDNIRTEYSYKVDGDNYILDDKNSDVSLTLIPYDISAKDENVDESNEGNVKNGVLTGDWKDAEGNTYSFAADGSYKYGKLTVGSALTIKVFKNVLGTAGGWFLCIGITLFAFSTILGWEYHGEKAIEYLFNTHKYNMIYRIIFSIIVYFGATTALDVVWSFSDIANALMAVPNLICMIALSGVIVKEVERFQPILKKEKAMKKETKKAQKNAL